MLSRIRNLLDRWFGPGQKDKAEAEPEANETLHLPREKVSAPSVLQEAVLPNYPVPYDKNLLERARTQWQFGDWDSLAELDQDTLQHHPDRAKLALLAAAGWLQMGHSDKGKKFIRLAHEWGINKKFISQILIAGVHNNLGRAAVLDNQQQKALQHFKNSINTGTPNSDLKLISQARINEQRQQIGFSTSAIPTCKQIEPTHQKTPSFEVETLATHDLGDAWAGNTINTVIFRHHGILTHQNIQYTAFYVDANTLRLVKRDLATETLTTFDLLGEYNLLDAHNSISLGIDRNSHLHISYDHHANQLHYRRSVNPHDITAWSDELPMTGAHEEKVTYPTFILPRHGFPLTFLYRDGIHDKGTARIKTYDEVSQTWNNHPEAILSGSEHKPWTSNPYWNHPAVGSDGSLHLSYVWRTHTLGEEQRINNINIGYAVSHDNGLSWQTSRKHQYKLPITQVNSETIYPVSPGSNLINQTSMALDSANRPHIVFYSDDPNGIPQYQHLWFDGKSWNHRIVSNRTQPFSLQGNGTLRIPISRPEIIIDNQDDIFIITRGDQSKNKITISLITPSKFNKIEKNTIALLDIDVGFSEPIIDRSRWAQSNDLTLLVQYTDQPNSDLGLKNIKNLAQLCDFKLHDTQN